MGRVVGKAHVDMSELERLMKQLSPEDVGGLFHDSGKRAASKGKKVIAEKIGAVYNLSPAQVKKNSRIFVKRTGGAYMGVGRHAVIMIRGPRLPVSEFGAEESGEGGIVVSIRKGERAHLKHAFVVDKWRGSFGGGLKEREPMVGFKRWPLKTLMNVSVPQMLEDEGVKDDVLEFVADAFMARFKQVLEARIAGKF